MVDIVILPFLEKIDFVSIAKELLKMKNIYYLIVLCINMLDKRYSKLVQYWYLIHISLYL